MSYYFTKRDARALKDAEAYTKWIESNAAKEDLKYAKAYDKWVEDNAPKAEFDLFLGDQDSSTEELTTTDHLPQMSADLQSMSPYKMLNKFSNKNRKDNKYFYNALRVYYGKSDKRSVRFQRTRGRINPPRRRVERNEKLSMLFAYS